MDALPDALTRRRFMLSSAALASTLQLSRAAVALGLATNAQVCQLAPEQEQGPFYVAGEQVRSDIAEDKAGVPLTLRLMLLDAHTCKPLANAAVDLWHCDAQGLYAGFTKSKMGMGPGGPEGRPGGPGAGPGGLGAGPGGRPPGPPPGGRMGAPENKPTDQLTFLRGIQMTDAAGSVTFRTIFPGFYQGRTNHIHFKVRIGGHDEGRTYAAGHVAHIGQLFFPEATTVKLMQQEPYRLHTIHRTTQAEDGVFTRQHGDLFVAQLRQTDLTRAAAGLHAELVIAADPQAKPAAIQPGPPQG